MVDSKENYKFDMGGKGSMDVLNLREKYFWKDQKLNIRVNVNLIIALEWCVIKLIFSSQRIFLDITFYNIFIQL